MPYHRSWISRHKVEVGVALVVAVALLGIGYLLGRGNGGAATSSDAPASVFHHDPPSATPATHEKKHHRRRHVRPPVSSSDMSGAPSWFVGVPLGGGGLHPGVDLVPGALHHAVLTVTSSTGSPIGIKYAFRTASGFRTGQTSTARSWSASATVRGTEPLEGLVAQVASGSVTCTASIDGQVVDRKTGSGRFATVSCFG